MTLEPYYPVYQQEIEYKMSGRELRPRGSHSAATVSRPPQSLIIRVSLSTKKKKNGAAFESEYYKGNDGFEGLTTDASLKDLEDFVRTHILSTFGQKKDGYEWQLFDHQTSGAYFYHRPEKPRVHTPAKINAKSKLALIGIFSDSDLKKAIKDYSYQHGRAVLLDLAVTIKEVKKVTNTPMQAGQKRQAPSSEDASSMNDSSSQNSAKKPGARKKKEPVPDNKVTIYLRLLRPTETGEKNGDEAKMIKTDGDITFATIAPQPAAAAESSYSNSDSDDDSMLEDAIACSEATRTKVGVLRNAILKLASEQTAYKRDDKSLVGMNSKVYYRRRKGSRVMTKIPDNTEDLWKFVINDIRKQTDATVDLHVSVGVKDDADDEYDSVLGEEDAAEFSQAVVAGTITLYSPKKAAPPKSNSSRRSSSQSRTKECSEWLWEAVTNEESPIYHSLTKEMFENAVRLLGDGTNKYLEHEGNHPELSQLPNFSGHAGKGCHPDHRVPTKGKYPLTDDGKLPSFPESTDGDNDSMAILGTSVDNMGQGIKEGNIASAKILSRGLSGHPVSFVLRLEYAGKEYDLLVGEDAYEMTISSIFKEMRKEHIKRGFMRIDQETITALEENTKEIVLSFANGASFVQYNKNRRDTKTVSELLSLVKDKDGTKMLTGKVEIEDVVEVSNAAATFDI